METSKVKLLVSGLLLALCSLQGVSQTSSNLDYLKDNHGSIEYNITDPSYFRLQSRTFVGMDVAVIPSINLLDEYLTRSRVIFRLGYRTKYNMLSGGIGVEFTDEMFLPIMAEYKRYFSTEKWAPFAFASAGFSWHMRGNMESHFSTSNYPEYARGVLLSAGVGYSVNTIMNEFYFSIGYAYREYIESKYISWNEKLETDKSMKGINLTVGLTF